MLPLLFGSLTKWLSDKKLERLTRQKAGNGKRRCLLLECETLEYRVVPAANFSQFVDPNPAPGNQFGSQVVPLSTGNVVITSPYDDAGGTDAGAVYLFNGSTGALISSLTGSHADDRVGYGGITQLSNGNFLVLSSIWDNGLAADAGAVTWGSGITGVSGEVDSTNSLVGSSTADRVGYGGIYQLNNGNYVVRSHQWNGNRGAITWGSGTSGVVGEIDSTNSLVGSSANDFVGNYGISPLNNGNYVVHSIQWNAYRGAMTWGSGTSGVTGVVDSTNSLVGSSAEDRVGYGGIYQLNNGNYVVRSYQWNGNRGAITWGSGTSGVVGEIDSTNSLVGSSANDYVGNYGIDQLNNGNYVVSTPQWNGSRGAVTLGSGTSGVVGEIDSTNSLVGSSSNDRVGYGGIYQLNNGNYLVRSPLWNGNRGAMTWGSGTSGVTGVVDSTNSLVGNSANDYVGNQGIYQLDNGNYVVYSYQWNGNRGAVTWGSGTSGVSGVVDSTNSLVGSSANDYVGNNGIYQLNNGNYVVSTPQWNGSRGAVTLGSGTSGVVGEVDSTNSLVGSSANDRVGSGGITQLSNGNYVVRSLNWNENRGAVTLGSGSSGVVGEIDSMNSLVGSSANDYVGNNGIYQLNNGNYVVSTPQWNGSRGAVTLGSGTSGVVGEIDSTNSLLGSSANDWVGNGGITQLSNGNYVVRSLNWNENRGAVTLGSGTSGVVGEIDSTNSLVGSSANDYVGNGIYLLNNGNYLILSPHWDNGMLTDVGAVTWASGTSEISGEIDSSNSLVGSTAGDLVGLSQYSANDAIKELTNGNYVVISLYWDNGVAIDAGAVSWGSGATGVSGVVNSTNSLVGSSSYDNVGRIYESYYNGNYYVANTMGVEALANGNYLVRSQYWHHGPLANAGAVTWGNGTTGISGVVSASNSLVGSHANDQVGGGNYYYNGQNRNVLLFPNGSYLVRSPYWDRGTIVDAGAITWGDGTTGVSGFVSSTNSLVGSTTSDLIGYGDSTLFSNGNIVITNYYWHNGSLANAGAATFFSGTQSIVGVVSNANSLIGTSANSGSAAAQVLLPDESYFVRFYNDQGGQVRVGSQVDGSVTYIQAALDGSGNLVISDPAGADSTFRIHVSGTDLIISDVSQPFTNNGGISGATLSNGNTTLTIPLASITGSKIIVNGGGGNDTLTVDFSGGVLTKEIDYDGGDNATSTGDKLVVTGGTFSTATHTFLDGSSGTLSYTGSALISYTGLEPVDMSGTTVDDLVLNLPAGGSEAFLEDDGTVGNGISQLRSNNASFELTTFSNPNNSLTVNRGYSDDTLTVSDLPDFTKTLAVGTQANPFATVTIAGTVNLEADENLTVDANFIYFLGSTSDVTLLGTGAATLKAKSSIRLNSGSSLSTTHGNILFEARVDGNGGGFEYGIALFGATLNSGTGTLSMIGRGEASSSNSNFGILIANSIVTSSGGNVFVHGQGGGVDNSFNNDGVLVTNGGVISAGGSGTVTVTGVGGNSNGDSNRGVYVHGTNSAITSSGGNVIVTGTGGGSAATGYNSGVLVNQGGQILAGGSGTVTVTGTGGGGQLNFGVDITDGGLVTSSGGNVSVTGTGGGTGSTNNNWGVLINKGGISAGNTGTVTVVGIGGTGTGTNNYGIYVTGPNAQISSSGGTISLEGRSSPGINNYGIYLEVGDAVVSGMNADVTLTTDSLYLADTGGLYAVSAGSGTLSIRNRTAGTKIDLGGADVLTGSPLTLGLSSVELIHVSAATLIIGRNDALASGSITFSAPATISASTPTLSLRTGTDITGSGTVSVNNLAMRAVTGITLTGTNNVDYLAAINTTSGGISYTDLNGFTVDNVDGLSGIIANVQAVSLTGGNNSSLNVLAPISATGTGGSIHVSTYHFMTVQADITTTSGALTLEANIDGSAIGDAKGIVIDDATVSTETGSLYLYARGGVSSNSFNHGVQIRNDGQVSSAGGNITITGYGGGSSSGSTHNHGVYMETGSITTAGAGTVLITGYGSESSGGVNAGVYLSGGTVVSSHAGTITIHGSSLGGGNSNFGVVTGNITSSGGGAISVEGALGGGGNNAAVQIDGVMQSPGGTITITGNAGGAINVNFPITASGPTGSVSIAAERYISVQANITAGNGISLLANTLGGLSGNFAGIEIHEAILNSGIGSLILNGTGGLSASDVNVGVRINYDSQVITTGGSISITGTGGGNASSGLNFGVYVFENSQVVAGSSGTVTITGQGGPGGYGSFNQGVRIESGSSVSSSGGNVSVTGTGGGTWISETSLGVIVLSGSVITAGGTGTVSVTGFGSTISTGDNHWGVAVAGAESEITSSGGHVTVTGTGGGAGSSAHDFGVYVVSEGSLSAGGMGNVTVIGHGSGGSAGSYQDGVFLSDVGSTITSSGGNVSVTGTGGGIGSSIDNFGVEVSNGAMITAGGMGTVTVVGYGSTTVSNSFANIGVSVHNANNSTITSSGGSVSVTGTGGGAGSTSYSYGVQVADTGTITAGGTGTVTVVGHGSLTGTGAYQVGVVVEANGTITSNNSAVSVTGTGGGTGGSGSNFGVFVAGGSTITAGGSSSTVTVTGTGGADGTGDNQFGIYVYQTDSQITSSGGDIVVDGTGGGSGASNSSIGVYLYNGAQINATGAGTVSITATGGSNADSNNFGFRAYVDCQIITNDGNITIVGTGGGASGGGSSNHGIYLENNVTISAGGTGDVTVSGTGGNAAGVANFGLYATYGSHITTQDGDISVTGTGQGHGTSSDDYGIWLQFGSTISAGGAGDVTVHGESTSTGTGNYQYGLVLENAGTGIFSNHGDVNVTGIAGGTGGGVSNNGVIVSAGSQIHAGGMGSVTVEGISNSVSEGHGNQGIVLVNSGVISTDDGDVTVTGTGGGTGSGGTNYGVYVASASQILAGGDGMLTVIGSGGAGASGNNNHGIYAQHANTRLATAGGDIFLTGSGGGTGTSTDNYGFFLGNGAQVVAPGSGNITVHGYGGISEGGYNHGVAIENANSQLNTVDGDITVVGVGGGVEGSVENWGVSVHDYSGIFAQSTGSISVTGTSLYSGLGVFVSYSHIQSTAGSVEVTGTAGGGTQNNRYGINVTGASTIYGSTVEVTGTGGTSTGYANIGVYVVADANISSAGGNVEVIGTGGGVDSSSDNYGIHVANGGTITAGGLGTVTVDGTGGITSGHRNFGVYVLGTAARITSSGGNIMVAGLGGGTGTSEDNYGVSVQSTGQITAGSTGSVTVVGQGGTQADGHNNYGVYVRDNNSFITSDGGSVTVTGTGGGTANSTFNIGVVVQESGIISTQTTGTVTVLGVGGAGASGNNYGVIVQNGSSQITSSQGTVHVTGQGGVGPDNYGVYLTGSVSLSSGSSNVNVTTDSLYISPDVSIWAGNGIVTLQTRTAGTLIDLGGTDVLSGSPLTLGISQAELNRVSAGKLRIGRNDATATGNIIVSENITIDVISAFLHLKSGGSISGTGTLSSGNLALEAATGITLTGDNNAGNLAAINTTNGGVHFHDSNGLTVDEVDGVVGITSTNTGGFVTLTTPWNLLIVKNISSGSGGVSLLANVNGTTAEQFVGIQVDSGAVIHSGTGPLTLDGHGGDSSSNYNYGLLINNNALLTSSGGNISVNGVGGGSGGSHANYGVVLFGGARIIAGGLGSVTATGTGGSSTGGSNEGVFLSGTNTEISSSGGNVLVNGTGGGTGAGGNNFGIELEQYPRITAGGTGSLSLIGTGGGGSGGSSYGIRLASNSIISSNSGPVSLVATPGNGPNSFGIYLAGSSSISSGNNANLNITTDSLILITNSSISSGNGNLAIHTRTSGTFIDLGGADSLSGSPLTLGLTDAELDRITAGSLTIGNATSGAITVTAPITHGNNLALTSGTTVTVNQPVTLATNKALSVTGSGITSNAVVTTDQGNVSLSATGGITLNAPLATGGGNLAMSADSDADGTGTVTLAAAVLNNWQQQQKVTSSDGGYSDFFGHSVALSTDGTTALIGAMYDSIGIHSNRGSAYVFALINGLWMQQAKLVADDGNTGDIFGSSVSLSSDGTTAIIGAQQDTVDSNSSQGAAYVFTLNNGSWTQHSKLTASDGEHHDNFGSSASISADGMTALIGARFDTESGNIDQGSAYIFRLIGDSWLETAKLIATDGAASDQFGVSVAMNADGTTALIGVVASDVGSNIDQGAAYVFTLGAGVWSQQAKLSSSDGAAQEFFGWSVALSSDGRTALIGAMADNIGTNVDQGSAYVFTFGDGFWTEQAKLTASDGATNDLFGWSVALSGDGSTAIVGAIYGDLSINSNQGSAYVFTLNNSIWTQRTELTASDGLSGDNFGISVALSSNGLTSLIGVERDKVGINTDQGSAYFYQNLTSTGGSINTGSGNAIIKGADADIQAAISSTGSVFIESEQSGRPINLGTESAGSLSLTAVELAIISAGTLLIGTGTSGALTVSADVAVNNVNTQLRSHNDIVFDGGQFNAGTGILNSWSAIGSILSQHAGVDATTSIWSTAYLSALQFNISGNAVDSQYDQLYVNGTVDLSNCFPILTGSYVPQLGDTFVLVDADNLTGTFTGMPDGSTVTFNGKLMAIHYTATQVTLAIANHPPVAVPGGPYTMTYGNTLPLYASGSYDIDLGDNIVSYAWDFNLDGVYDYTSNTAIATAPWSALAAAGINAGSGTIRLRVTDLAGDSATATTTLNVNQRLLTFTATAVHKVYDATTLATVNFNDNRVVGDVINYSYLATFNNKNVGNNKPVTVTGIAITGGASGNYILSGTTASTTANITKRNITLTATGVNRVYNGTVSSTVTLTDNRIAGDVLSRGYTSVTFADKNVGTGKVVTVTGLRISGTDAANYQISSTTTTTTANITPRTLTVSASVLDKIYDGTTTATVQTLGDNRLAGDVLTVNYVAANFVNKNAGLNKSVTVSGLSLSGADGGNYTVAASVTTTADIEKRDLTVAATGINKVYNGNTFATVTLSDNRIAGDVFTTTYVASFDDKNVGAGKAVTVADIVISGTVAANYDLQNTATDTTADITPRALVITAVAASRVYDGTTAATATLSDNRVAGDDLATSYATAAFADKNVGTAKVVTISGISVTGSDAGNYTFNTSATATANITKRALVVTATALDKVYDRTTLATVTLADNRVPGDILSVSNTTAVFANKNAGVGKTVTVSGITITGTDAANYTFNTSTTTTATITPRALLVTATGINRVYDGTTIATATLYDNRIAGDVLTRSYTAAFADKNVGTGKAVNVAVTITGTDALNYIANPTTSTTANITRRTLTITGTGTSKTYDGTTAAVVTLNDNRVVGDVFSNSYVAATFNNKNVGNNKPITVSGVTISGADAGNYSHSSTTTAVANITSLAITVTANPKTKVYGAADPVLNYIVTNGALLPGDVFSGALSRVAGQNVGTYAILKNTLNNNNYSITYVGADLTITKAMLTVKANNATRQYSDVNPTFTATTTGYVNGDNSSTAFTGSASLTTSADLASATGTYPIISAVGTLASANYNFTFVNGTLTVAAEDARATYTGPRYVVTASAATSTVIVPLSATISDISSVIGDPAFDGTAGDISEATVTFINRANGSTIAANLPITLVNINDVTIGTVSYDWMVSLGSADAAVYTVGMVINNSYTRNASTENAVITVKKPTAHSVGGAGSLINTASSGTYAGGVGATTDFGLYLKYLANGTGLTGSVNIISRAANGNVYQFTSTAISTNTISSPSLGVTTSSFTGLVTARNITNPASAVTLGTNLPLSVQLTDNGEPGLSDTIALTITNTTGDLLFSSNWNGTSFVEQLLDAGNLQIRQAQLLEGRTGNGLGVSPLLQKQLAPIVAAAKAAWLSTGLTPEQQQALQGIDFQIDNLPGVELGWQNASCITIDQDAAGHGWFIDPTPNDPSEFAIGAKNSAARGHVDLLTVVAHEIGHSLGLDDHTGENELMSETLALGVRRVPMATREMTITSAESIALAVAQAVVKVEGPSSSFLEDYYLRDVTTTNKSNKQMASYSSMQPVEQDRKLPPVKSVEYAQAMADLLALSRTTQTQTTPRYLGGGLIPIQLKMHQSF